MTDLRLFDVPDLEAAPEAEPAPAAEPAAAPAPRVYFTRPKRVMRLGCYYRCGWSAKRPIAGGLDEFGEQSVCPTCKRPAAIVVRALLTR